MSAPAMPSALTRRVIRRFRDRRLHLGLSARELAERCAGLGQPKLTRGAIAKLENGNRTYLTLDQFVALSIALGYEDPGPDMAAGRW